jgi:hypothetical protein
VALNTGQGDANPKGTLAIIFAIVGGFMLLLLFVQGRELAAASRASAVAPGAAGAAIDNPMVISEAELWAAMAVAPITDEALGARGASWEMARDSMRTARVVIALILVVVPATYLLESFVPILIGAPLIAGYALIKGLGVAGGGLDRGYENVGLAMAPLGLAVTERPRVGVTPRMAPSDGLKTQVTGGLQLAGRRHGRRVEIHNEGGASTITVVAAAAEFTARSSDGKIRAKRGTVPDAVEAALGAIPASVDWKNLAVSSTGSLIEVRRKHSDQRLMLADLWLAERLADSLP